MTTVAQLAATVAMLQPWNRRPTMASTGLPESWGGFDAPAPIVSESGVFIDGKTGKVVYSQPEEGIQLVAPGGIIDDVAAAYIEAQQGT